MFYQSTRICDLCVFFWTQIAHVIFHWSPRFTWRPSRLDLSRPFSTEVPPRWRWKDAARKTKLKALRIEDTKRDLKKKNMHVLTFDFANNSENINSSLNAVEALKWYWCELKWVKCQQSMSSFFRRKFPRCVSWFHDSGLACSNTSQALSLHFRNFDWSVFLLAMLPCSWCCGSF